MLRLYRTAAIALLLAATPLFAGAPTISWARPINGGLTPSNDDGYLVAVDGDGNPDLAGNVEPSGDTSRDVLIARVNADGSLAWKQTFAGDGNNLDEVCGVGLDAMGHFYVGGYRFGAATHMDWFINKYDAAGNRLWATTFGDNNSQSDDRAFSFKVAPDGSSAMVGWISVGGLLPAVYTAARFDSAGNLLWSTPIAGWPRVVEIATDGSLYIGGSVVPNPVTRPFDPDLWVAKFDTAGAQQWAHVVAGGSNSVYDDWAGQIQLLPNGDLIVAGSLFLPTTARRDVVTMRLTPGGTELWRRTYNAGFDEIEVGLAVDRDSERAYVIASQGLDGRVVAYNGAGTQLWARNPGGDPDIATVQGQLIAVAPDGSVFHSLMRRPGTDRLVGIDRLDPDTGLVLNALTYTTAGLDLPADMSFASNGDLYLTGTENFTLAGPTSDAFILRVDVPQPILVGDANCDGIVSVGDISPFVLALTDPTGYVTLYPDCDLLSADTNADGVVSVGDIAGFVSLLTGV